MNDKKVICECTCRKCKCKGRCIEEAQTVVVAGDSKERLAVCRACGSQAVDRGDYHYSAHANQEIEEHCVRLH